MYSILVVGTFILITVLSVLYFSTYDGKNPKGLCIQLILFFSLYVGWLSSACGVHSCTQVPLQHKKACVVYHHSWGLGAVQF